MRIRIRHVRKSERGMTLVFVGLGLLPLLAVSMLAIDVGMVMTGRNQAQNAADAGALAGAISLVFDDYDDRSSSGPAVQNSLGAARANTVMGQTVSVEPADVTFPNDPNGQPNRVKVDVFLTGARGNPVATLVAKYFGRTTVDVTATATAEAAPANMASCIFPFTVADKWTERQTPAWDSSDTFSAFPLNPSVNPDQYVATDQAGYTGFSPTVDLGLQLTIKSGNNISPSFYHPIALPGSSGADDYRWSIANCNTSRFEIFDSLTAEPGDMVGPTKQGIEDLIARDPGAYWDATNKRVVSTMHPSPRVKLMPVYDPYYFDVGKQAGRTADLKTANFIGLFVEGMQGNDVVGRIVPSTGILDTSVGPVPSGAFTRAVRMVQ